MQPPPTKAESILARFPGPVTLSSSRKKWFSVFLVCFLVGAAGLAMVLGETSGGWFLFVIFGVLSIVALGMLLPGASSLRLDELGFVATKFFRPRRVRWQDATRFAAIELQQGRAGRLFAADKMVVYDDAGAAGGFFALLNKSLADRNAYLPDTYGLDADELCWLMTQWRDRAMGHLLM